MLLVVACLYQGGRVRRGGVGAGGVQADRGLPWHSVTPGLRRRASLAAADIVLRQAQAAGAAGTVKLVRRLKAAALLAEALRSAVHEDGGLAPVVLADAVAPAGFGHAPRSDMWTCACCVDVAGADMQMGKRMQGQVPSPG